MAVQSQVSYANYVSGAVLAGSYQAAWPITNLRYPQQPFTVAKTVDRGTVGVGVDTNFDFGAPFVNQLIMLVNTNYTQVDLYGHNGGAALWGFNLVMARCNWHDRYGGVAFQPSVVATRYLQIRIPGAQATTDGQNYYSTGGVWVGGVSALPSDIRWDERPRIIEPHIDRPLIGGGTHRVRTGRRYVEMHAQRLALTAIDTPATNDDLAGWLAHDEAMHRYGIFAWYFNRGNVTEGFIFRKMNESAWNVNQILSEDELILHEVIGP